MTIQEFVPLGSKTTMRIGGKARYYVELLTKEDVEQAVKFSAEKGIPLIPLGGGSNTIFADGVIEALVVRVKTDMVSIEKSEPDRGTMHRAPTTRVTVQAGKILASLINELAAKDLDLSALTGIPGTVGGAIFGNAGQGHGGMWIGNFVESVTAYVSGQWTMDNGQWKIFTKEEYDFRYRESWFKDNSQFSILNSQLPVIWEATLNVPSRPSAEIKADVHRLLQLRIATQPHLKTAGSCFKSLSDGTPAWKLIDAAGLRGLRIGDIQIAEKHANFLLNVGEGRFEDACAIVKKVREKVPRIEGVEMQLYGYDGRLIF